MGNCARKHESPPVIDANTTRNTLFNSYEPPKNVIKSCSRVPETYKSNSLKILHSNARTHEPVILCEHDNTLNYLDHDKTLFGKDVNSGSRSNLSTPQASVTNVAPGTHFNESLQDAMFPATYHLQRLALEHVAKNLSFHQSTTRNSVNVDHLDGQLSVSPVHWHSTLTESSDENILHNTGTPYRSNSHVQSHSHLQQHSSSNIIPLLMNKRYSRSGCVSATRSAMESPLTIDSGTHKSDKPYRSSVVMDSDRLKNIEQNIMSYNGRTVSTTPTMFVGDGNSDHRSSVGGLSARYLVHQPYNPPNAGSPSRLSLASGGAAVNPKKTGSLTQDSFKAEHYHIAIFDYEAHTAEEVGARKGDQLRVLDFRKVKIEFQLSDAFEVKTRVRQGCLLSSTIFLIVMDWIMQHTVKSEKMGIRWTDEKSLEDSDFADDLCLMSHKLEDLKAKTNKLTEEAGQRKRDFM
ncbi:unnamed protein product [Heterobilharzia americana]|nr:unnamed protein product [Heterobilharzia americana]